MLFLFVPLTLGEEDLETDLEFIASMNSVSNYNSTEKKFKSYVLIMLSIIIYITYNASHLEVEIDVPVVLVVCKLTSPDFRQISENIVASG